MRSRSWRSTVCLRTLCSAELAEAEPGRLVQYFLPRAEHPRRRCFSRQLRPAIDHRRWLLGPEQFAGKVLIGDAVKYSPRQYHGEHPPDGWERCAFVLFRWGRLRRVLE